jgi:hypothetical protein
MQAAQPLRIFRTAFPRQARCWLKGLRRLEALILREESPMVMGECFSAWTRYLHVRNVYDICIILYEYEYFE